MHFLDTTSWPLLIWSGLVGLGLSAWVLMMLRKVGATRFLPRAYWSCGLFGSTRDALLALAGTLRMVAMVALFPLVYAFVFAQVGRAEALIGAIIGALHGVFAGLLLPFAARRCAGALAPGVLGWNLGKLTPIVLILVHALYGATLGYVYVIPPA